MQRAEWIGGLGFNVAIDCTGITPSIAELIQYVAPYGIYTIPGIATPVGELPISLTSISPGRTSACKACG